MPVGELTNEFFIAVQSNSACWWESRSRKRHRLSRHRPGRSPPRKQLLNYLGQVEPTCTEEGSSFHFRHGLDAFQRYPVRGCSLVYSAKLRSPAPNADGVASEITLTDGRTLKQLKIVSYAAHGG